MTIETTEDLANQIADWLGIYGACKHGQCQADECLANSDEHCLHGGGCTDENPLCCRQGFMMEFPDRIRKAVENEKKLKLAEL